MSYIYKYTTKGQDRLTLGLTKRHLRQQEEALERMEVAAAARPFSPKAKTESWRFKDAVNTSKVLQATAEGVTNAPIEVLEKALSITEIDLYRDMR